MSREEAAARLRTFADKLAQNNDIEFERGGMQFKVHVPDEIHVKVELELETDERELDRADLVRSGKAGSALADARRLDLALYSAVAGTRTPALDARSRPPLPGREPLEDLDRARICARTAAAAGTAPGRRCGAWPPSASPRRSSTSPSSRSCDGGDRTARGCSRPDDRGSGCRRLGRFPSGHTAAAFAFATGVGRELGWAGPPLYALASLVGYSRVHTGVHYPLDVIVGALAGVALGELTGAGIDRAGHSRPQMAEPGTWPGSASMVVPGR